MVRVGAGLSIDPDPGAASTEAARAAAAGLGGEPPDLVVAFASGSHLGAAEAILDGVRDQIGPGPLIGCGAGGVLGGGREFEANSAVAVWAARFGIGAAIPFHATVSEEAEGLRLEGLPDLEDTSGLIVLADPYTFPTEAMLAEVASRAPGVPVLGGLASARIEAGATLLADDGVRDSGAVGVALHGVEVLPCVSQGAVPLGPEATITAAEGNVIYELAGRPALTTVERIIGGLSEHERALVADGLLVGIVIDGGKPEYEQGDFLVRGVLGADRESGAVAVGAPVQPGQVIRLHARDAQSADADLRRELRLRSQALSGDPPAGALLFSCNGRGRAMFGTTDHDAAMVEQELSGAPTAGFFAAGEIGPVGGRSFLHGFTATVAVFPG